MKHDSQSDLIQRLSRDLKQVKPWRPEIVSAILISSAIVYAIVCNFTLLTARPDLIDRLGSWWYALLLLLPVLLLIFASLQMVHSSLLSINPRWRIGPLRFAVFSLYLLAATMFSLMTISEAGFSLQRIDWKCSSFAVFLAIPIWISCTFAASLIGPRNRGFQKGALVMGLATGLWVMNAHCPYEEHGHYLTGHALMPLVFMILLYAPYVSFMRRLMSRLSRSRIQL